MLQYHVQCVGKKKIVTSEEKHEVPAAIAKVFALHKENDLSLQYYDAEWDDWISVENLDELPERGKLQATVVITMRDGGETSQLVNSNSLDVTNTVDVLPISSSAPICTESSQHGKKCPVPFPIKERMFRRAVWDKLNKKAPLNQVERGYVLDGLYEECVRYCMYLDSFKYSLVLTSLLETFPYLQDGLSSGDALGLWKNRLRSKFKNNRRRRDQAQPEVQAKKSKTIRPNKEAQAQNQNPVNIWNVVNFLPPRPSSEDDASIERHIMHLQEQHKRLPGKRDISVIADAMMATLSERRSLIVKRCALLQDVQAEYPILFSENEMIAEFNRLLGCDTQKNFSEGLEKYSAAISRLPPLKEEHASIQELRINAALSTKTKRERKYAFQCMALLLLHGNLKEKMQFFIRKGGEDEVETSQPCIVWYGNSYLEGHFKIYAENILIAESKCLIKACLILLSCCYVFNLAFPKNMTSTLTFLQKVLLGHNDDAKKEVKVVNLLAKINRLMLSQ